jgi:hypothetical protein
MARLIKAPLKALLKILNNEVIRNRKPRIELGTIALIRWIRVVSDPSPCAIKVVSILEVA